MSPMHYLHFCLSIIYLSSTCLKVTTYLEKQVKLSSSVKGGEWDKKEREKMMKNLGVIWIAMKQKLLLDVPMNPVNEVALELN